MKKTLILLGLFFNAIYSIARAPDDFYCPDPEDKPDIALNIIIIIIIIAALKIFGNEKDNNK